jgi:hypothetical protein
MTNTYNVTFVGDYATLTTTINSVLDLDGDGDRDDLQEEIAAEAADHLRQTMDIDVTALRLDHVDIVVEWA